MDIIEYSNKTGFYIRSDKLAKYLGIRHQDFVRKLLKVSKGYIPHGHETCKYSPNGKRLYYKLTRTHINKLGFIELEEEMIRQYKERAERTQAQIRKLFGVD